MMLDPLESFCHNCNKDKQTYNHGFCTSCHKRVKVINVPNLSSATRCELTGLDRKGGNDPVNPTYYRGRRVMDIINEFNLSFCMGTLICYVLRHKEKNGVEDLKKAVWYLTEEIRILEEERDALSKLPNSNDLTNTGSTVLDSSAGKVSGDSTAIPDTPPNRS